MVKFVIKRDGRVEPYNIEKIKKSIVIASTYSASEDTNTQWLIDQVLIELEKSFEGTERVPTEELRKKIFKKLNSVAPEVALTWREYKK